MQPTARSAPTAVSSIGTAPTECERSQSTQRTGVVHQPGDRGEVGQRTGPVGDVREDDDGDPLVQRRGEHRGVEALVDVGRELADGHPARLGDPGHDVAVGGEVVGRADQHVAPGPRGRAGRSAACRGSPTSSRRRAPRRAARPSTPAARTSPTRVGLADPRRPRADQPLAPTAARRRGRSRPASPGAAGRASCRRGRAAGRASSSVPVEAGAEAGERIGVVERLGGGAGEVHGPCLRHGAATRCLSPSTVPPVTQLHDLTALEQAAAVRAGEVQPDRAGRALPRAHRGARRRPRRLPHRHPGARPACRGPRREGAARAAATCPRCSASRPRSRTSTTPPACGRRSARW